MLKKALKLAVKEKHRALLRRSWNRAVFFGYSRHCPVCGNSVRCFLPHGIPSRPDAVCPICSSKEPHRLAWLYFQHRTDIFHAKLSLLHIAPEPEIEKKLRQKVNLHYISGDINPGLFSMKMDITRMPFDNDSFDVIYCCHVLNMVGDDYAAMKELRRVLKPDGWALLQIPVSGPVTREASDSSNDRLRLFGDAMMYRTYGDNITERLRSAGFMVTVERSTEMFGDKQRKRFGLRTEQLYICKK